MPWPPILLAALLPVAVVAAGCGGHRPPSAEQVARSWSAALDRSDDESAALLFAPGARIVQNGELKLTTHADALQWNANLPCGGKIVSVSTESSTDVLVVFELTRRPRHTCDAPGHEAAAIFRIRDGKIVLWHQTDVPPASAGGTLAARSYFGSGSSL